MKLARIAGSWVTNGKNTPQLRDDYAYHHMCDVTAQPAENIPTEPNEFTVQVVLDDAVLSSVESDSTYSVLWSEDYVELQL